MRGQNILSSLILCVTLYTFSAVAQDPAPVGEMYKVNAGDELEVSVWGEESLQKVVLIRPDGGFSYPLAGDLVAAGRSVGEIRAELTERLSKYIPNSVVTVTVTGIGGNMIYIIGQVKAPGSYVMNPRVDVMQALSMAGGTTAFADLNDIKILRRTEAGQRVLAFHYNEVARGKNLEQNILLQSGDVVVVP